MALTNNSNKIIKSLELSIQISLSGLSFCILQRDSNTIIKLRSINFEKSLTPFEVLDCLKDLFSNDPDLQNTFQKVSIIHDNDISAQVPKDLFDETYLADYLKFNSKILKSDFITYDAIIANNCINVYVPYININNFVYEKFGTFTFKHVSTILIEALHNLEKNKKSTKIYINVCRLHFELVVFINGELHLYNSYKYNTSEDFIYYILFVAEQLDLNPQVFDLVFLGEIDKNDDLYQICYKYIRNISFGTALNTFIFKDKPKTEYSDFTLLNSL
ncbi:DUF3822 family protein [Algibacter mikhailovii]|uniref:DUF3822 family protein n=1 Tax=Algibacter mikhailovii TaxID=425498 RepID=A0A918V573_9FLAO|nr:DUF3822 family protein [Algibacter mikhailovii]GGZ70603.1 hypothetical protein GCM10007028_04730 [Algibacter mikhailovii]